MKTDEKNSRFSFIGNDRCIDFINTELIKGGETVDLLSDFEFLVEWLTESELISLSQKKYILEKWKNTPESIQTLKAAREFRAVLKKMIDRMIAEEKVESETVDKINEYLRHQNVSAKIFKSEKGFEKSLLFEFVHPAQLLTIIAAAAADFLCSADFKLVKKCESESCVLYFYDTTKNHARRWCSMNSCGNRMKVSAHYRRLRQNES